VAGLLSSKKRGVITLDTPFGKVQAEEMDFKVIKNDPILIEVEDGSVIKVRLFPTKVSRGIDPKTKGVLISPQGEPLYNVAWATALTSETPPDTLERMRKGGKS
jgi:hypothetical protein